MWRKKLLYTYIRTHTQRTSWSWENERNPSCCAVCCALCYAMHVAYFMNIVVLHAYEKIHTLDSLVVWLVSHKISRTLLLIPLNFGHSAPSSFVRHYLFAWLIPWTCSYCMCACVCVCWPMSISTILCAPITIHILFASQIAILGIHMKIDRHIGRDG